ncbi:hypothetical protein GZ77_26145 [Endozoicomonas montiporae]|uniref:Uncharacterized protein n=1 Tax=Endozoicomonas montiporae TaxID=1027273 RepID=A0A081MYM0_9GAMM|nr:hypothetical protein [Endozoicomonas montiporae]KEQ11255.1 hypothetical protein GZ77_26530 [Endozoicomonas montiporae]KEQ11293.1 hypothetical protein GZ77_26145 [Endozoicomonas montiporae]
MAALTVISLAMGIAELIGPKVVGLFAGDKGEQVAEQVISIAQGVTNEPDPVTSLAMLRGEPELAAQFQLALLQQESSLVAMAYEDRADARQMYLGSEAKTADRISQQVMSWNVWFVLALVVINAGAVFLLTDVTHLKRRNQGYRAMTSFGNLDDS